MNFVGFIFRKLKYEQRPQPVPRGRLGSLSGKAEKETYMIGEGRTNIGRLSETVDEHGRVLRRNDVVFPDIDGINRTVSRIHAHICFDRDTGEFRLWDDNSTEGTFILRGRNPTEVARGGYRGVKLNSGDEIHFGQARVRFEKK